MTITLHFDLPDAALIRSGITPDEFARELQIAAAVKWYERGELSQGKAAEVAGISRTEFITALSSYKVSPFQETI
jgi:predicted HTH domain antitoxin